VQIQCLGTRVSPEGGPEELWACSSESSGFLAGVSTDQGASFKTKLRFATIRGPLSCQPSDSAKVCEKQWRALQIELGLITPMPEPEEDAGAAADAQADASAAPGSKLAPSPQSIAVAQGGCNTSGSGASLLVGLGLAAVIAARLGKRK
jgi:hypothetical protein